MSNTKKRLFAFLTAASCLTGLVSAMTASAVDIGFSYEAARAITIETDTFQYSNCRLETETVDANCMVVGVSDDGAYLMSGIGENPAGGDIFPSYFASEFFGDTRLSIGDLLKIDGDCTVCETFPSSMQPRKEECTITHVGNGEDVLGEEFKRVVRLEAIMKLNEISWAVEEDARTNYMLRQAEDHGIIDYFGDLNLDDAVDILDCITINKQLLGSDQLSDYVRIFGDVNSDGVLDATDSLLILKEVVGLTEGFEEV